MYLMTVAEAVASAPVSVEGRDTLMALSAAGGRKKRAGGRGAAAGSRAVAAADLEEEEEEEENVLRPGGVMLLVAPSSSSGRKARDDGRQVEAEAGAGAGEEGIKLHQLLGSGSYGRVFSAEWLGGTLAGAMAAVKVRRGDDLLVWGGAVKVVVVGLPPARSFPLSLSLPPSL